jgi:NitT/TauT family transport system ATP-binding protein
MANALVSSFATPSESGVRIDHVSKSFRVGAGEVHAVHDVSLTVESGEFLTLLGPSGCGKSTLLRLLAGLDAPDSGELLVEGDRIRKPSIARG